MHLSIVSTLGQIQLSNKIMVQQQGLNYLVEGASPVRITTYIPGLGWGQPLIDACFLNISNRSHYRSNSYFLSCTKLALDIPIPSTECSQQIQTAIPTDLTSFHSGIHAGPMSPAPPLVVPGSTPHFVPLPPHSARW